MSRFPALLDRQRRALFDMVEAFRKCKMEGRTVMVVTELGYPRLIFSMGEESPHIDSDLDTLRVLDKVGYVAFTEKPQKGTGGSEWVERTLILTRLACDYYDWFHSNAWYKPIVDKWYLLAPDSRSAIVGAVVSAIVYSVLPFVVRACTEFLASAIAKK